MHLVLLVLAAAAASAPAPPTEDIVVIAERMRRLKLSTRTDRKTGETACVLKRSSGDPAFDSLMCKAVLACAPQVKTRPDMEACLRPHIAAHVQSLSSSPAAAPQPAPLVPR